MHGLKSQDLYCQINQKDHNNQKYRNFYGLIKRGQENMLALIFTGIFNMEIAAPGFEGAFFLVFDAVHKKTCQHSGKGLDG